MGLPVFASDRDFVRSVCGDVPFYIDPTDPQSSARVVADALARPDLLAAAIRKGRAHVDHMPSAKERASTCALMIDEALMS